MQFTTLIRGQVNSKMAKRVDKATFVTLMQVQHFIMRNSLDDVNHHQHHHHKPFSRPVSHRAQTKDHKNTKEATGSNPVEALKRFFQA